MNISSSTVALVVIGLFIVILLAGFLFGLARGFNKSLVRAFMVIGCVVVAFFLSSVITKAIMEVNIYNLGINVAGERVSTLKGALQALLNQVEAIREISETPAYATIMEVIPKMIVNVAMFILVFYVLRLLTMIIYWIIAGTAFSKKKTEGKNKHRLVGSLIGVVQNFIIFLVLLVPVFGAVSVFNQVETITNASAETTAGSIAEDSYAVLMDSSEESESQSNTKFKEAYNSINNIISAYNDTWVAKMLSGVKLDKACVSVFDKLSTVEKDGVKYSLREEVEGFSYIYKDGKSLLDLVSQTEDKKLDFTNEEQIAQIKALVTDCYKSKLAANLIDDVIKLAVDKWDNDEKFMNIEKPNVGEDFQGVLDNLLEKLAADENKKDTLISTIDVVNTLLTTAKKVEEDAGEISTETISNLLNDIASDPNVKDLAKEVVLPQLETIAEKLLPADEQEDPDHPGETIDANKEYRDIIVEVATSIINADYSEEQPLEKEIAVITESLSVYEKLTNNEEVTQEDATKIIEALDDSSVILEELSKVDSPFAKTIRDGIGADASTKELIKNAIDAEGITNVAELYTIFGIEAE